MRPALTPGANPITLDSIVQRYHVHAGPVCVVHPGGPGVNWDHLRLRGLEGSNMMVYVEPIGRANPGDCRKRTCTRWPGTPPTCVRSSKRSVAEARPCSGTRTAGRCCSSTSPPIPTAFAPSCWCARRQC